MEKTVAQFAGGDLSIEMLRGFRVDSSVLCRSVMAAPWGFGVAGRDVGSFHMVLEGQGWLKVEGRAEPIPIRAGDLVLLPRGDAHWVKDSPGTAAPSLASILAQRAVVDGQLRFGGVEGPVTEIVCGVFSTEDGTTAPWSEWLPAAVVSRAEPSRSNWQSTAAAVLRDEARHPTAGGAVVVNRLLELLLVDALRQELAELANGESAAGVAVADERIGRVLARVRASPADPWTLDSLARVAAMSRSAFSERFRGLVGEAPIRYLTGQRLARAARLVRSTDMTLAEVARRVGYGSEEAFSRAFKARFGDAPSVFRRRAPTG
jgi:AraC-like DNA-binding protein